MGVEVSWRLIKEICSNLACLAPIIGALCKFIRRQLMQSLHKNGAANGLIREPKPTKEMPLYDAVQDMHPKTLSGCFIIATCTTKRNADILYRDMMEAVMKSGHPRAPLNLKVLTFHHDRIGAGEALPLELLDLKTVLMPRQWFLDKLDSPGNSPFLHLGQ